MQSAISDSFIRIILPVLATGLAGLLGWVFKALAQKLTSQAKESKLAAVGTRIAMLADVVVADIEATLRPKLAQMTADGQLSAAEASELKATAMDRLKALLAEKGLNEVKGVFGIFAPQIELLLSGAIERAVDRLPESTPAVSVITIPTSASPTLPLPPPAR